jgi:hypothetical protein
LPEPTIKTLRNPQLYGLILLALLSVAMMVTNPWFSVFDDEAYIISVANEADALNRYLHLHAHQHPPLSDILLQLWLKMAGQSAGWIRLPFVLFYLAGIWCIANCAEVIAGRRAKLLTILLISLWPLGFHYGRAAGWYTPSFFFIALLSWKYLSWLQERTALRSLALTLTAVALVLTNYFGWVILGILFADFQVFRGKQLLRDRGVAVLWMAGIALALGFTNYWPRVVSLSGSDQAWITRIGYGVYSFYVSIVSEAVAPWAWPLSVPVSVAILLVILLVLRFASAESRRFFLYFCIALALLGLVGAANPKRLMFLCPWLLLALGIAVTEMSGSYRRALVVALLVIACTGMYGMVARSSYSSFQWIEPWPRIATELQLSQRETILTSHPSALFYLFTRLEDSSHARFRLDHPLFAQNRVYTPYAEPIPQLSGRVVLLRGAEDRFFREELAALGERCSLRAQRNELQDSGRELKGRYFPAVAQPEWRIVVLEYDCP